jgi:putative restriction endonuclease
VPAAPRAAILEATLSAVQESGYSGVVISPQRHQPARFALVAPDGREIGLAAYAWTLTPGGRPQLANEYRIQMTSVESPLAVNPDEVTVLIGYEPDLRMFAGFDLARHRTFTTGSPSIQVDIRSLRQALQDGLAFSRKSNSEIAIGIRPDQFMGYALNAENLHRYGRDALTFDLLTRASSLERIPEREVEALTAQRRRVLSTVSRLSRLASFRQTVLQAYDHRCAVTRMQLRLVEAAHILPVGAPGSIDDVRNGIALSPTYHRAYDNGLIFLSESLEMRVNPRKRAELTRLDLAGGIEAFRSLLGRIHLPPDRAQWPNPGFISRANRYRQVPTH